MSKRHRKSKLFISAIDGDYEDAHMGGYIHMDLPRGKKPRGKQKRQSLKRAYYDD